MIKTRETTVGYHCPNCGLSILNSINLFSLEGNLIKIKCVCGGSELIAQSLKNNKFRITVPCILCPNSHSYTLSSGVFFEKELFSFTCKFTAIDICFIGKSDKVFEAIKKNEDELMKTFAAYADEDEEDDYFDDDDIFGDYDDEDDDYDDDDEYFDDDYDDEFEGFDPLDLFGGFENMFGPGQGGPGFVLHKNKDAPPAPERPARKGADAAADDITGQGAVQLRAYQVTAQILDALAKLCRENKVLCKCGDFDGKILLTGGAVHIECKNCGSYRDIKSSNAADADYLNDIERLQLDFDE